MVIRIHSPANYVVATYKNIHSFKLYDLDNKLLIAYYEYLSEHLRTIDVLPECHIEVTNDY